MPTVLAVVLLPIAVSLIALVGEEWYPGGDIALEVMQADEVGGSRTPLTGAWSRWGWDHPGPLLFWLFAPFTKLLGPIGILWAVALLNGVAMAGSLLVAMRRGGRSLAVLSALALVVLCSALGAGRLVDPWNPWAAVLPFFAFMLLAWAVGDGDVAMAPWLVAVGTFTVQSHAGYLVLATGIGLTAGLMAWRGRRATPKAHDGQSPRRSMIAAAAVGAVLWLPPLVQQVFGNDGNLGALIAFALDPTEPAAGWRRAVDVLGTELGFPGAWLAGGDDGPFGVPGGSIVPALMLLVLTGALGSLAAKRGAPGAGRMGIIVLAASGFGVVSTARVTGPVYNYLVRWWWVIAAVAWLSVLWSLWSLLRRADVRAAVLIGSLGAAGLLAVLLGWNAVHADLPEPHHSQAVRELADEVSSTLDPDKRYLVEWVDSRGWGGAGTGLFLELRRRGFDVSVPANYQPAFEPWQTARPEDVRTTILVVGNDDLDTGFIPPTDASVVASHDPLSAHQRARAEELSEAIERQLGSDTDLSPVAVGDDYGRARLRDAGVDPAMIEELHELREIGFAYTAYLVAPA